MDVNENLFDIIFLTIVLVLGLLAFLRGFIREIFSVLNWILAIFLTYALSPVIMMFIDDNSLSSLIIGLISQTILFTVSLIIISIFTSKISRPLSDRMPFLINQPLGLAFGIGKAYLMVALIFSIITTIYSYDILELPQSSKQVEGRVGPDWLQNSISYEILEVGAEFLQPVVDVAINSIKMSALKSKDGMSDQIIKKLDDINEKDSDELQEYLEEGGYGIEDLQKMQNLIRLIGN